MLRRATLVVLLLAALVGCADESGPTSGGEETNNGVANNDVTNTNNDDTNNGGTNNGELLPEIDTSPLADADLSGLTPIPPSAQRVGDAEAGLEYLLYGDYVGSGIAYDAFVALIGDNDQNLLGREGDNAAISPSYNAFDAPNGARVVGGLTCFGCHASWVDGQYILGAGNTFIDFSGGAPDVRLALSYVQGVYGRDSPEAEATEIFVRGASAASGYTQTPFAGVNPAFRLEEAAAAWRHPEDLRWLDEPLFEVVPDGLASDTPPWWNVKKKTALYYNGMGRGDFSRMIQQIMVVSVTNLEQAESIDTHAPDVLAWIMALEPPAYPLAEFVSEEAAAEGKLVFEERCASCHGTYGDDESYPGLLVPLEEVGTDPLYARYFVENGALARWFNQSWFAEGVEATPKLGYVALPLDGIWASAPYLHNGSVPTVAAVIDPAIRPARWRRDFSTSQSYDLAGLGWLFERVEEGTEVDRSTYDTRIAGYGNQGHLYGEELSVEERRFVLEYLKTL